MTTLLERIPETTAIGPKYDDRYYLEQAYEIAISKSPDPSTQNGVVLIDSANNGFITPDPTRGNHIGSGRYLDDGILVRAANHFPSGVRYEPSRWERPLKYSYIEHAERNAIYQAARKGIATEGLTIVGVWVACCDCARAIIQAGIKEVVTHKFPGSEGNAVWQETIAIAMKMLTEAGVIVRYYEGEIGIKGIRFNGQLVDR